VPFHTPTPTIIVLHQRMWLIAMDRKTKVDLSIHGASSENCIFSVRWLRHDGVLLSVHCSQTASWQWCIPIPQFPDEM